jgi:hypothetical protein|tara:strand:- start:465 stop:752 length:288 start_codon:yes stop_codon:yes gene_type:complete
MAKEKVKELKVKNKVEKIHEKHLKQMQDVVNTINAIQYNIGKMEVQKQTALDEMKNQQRKIAEVQDLLVREYGTFDVNVNDGTINWPKEKKDEKK